MSDVVIFKAGEIAQYLKSVNTPDHINAYTLINPDLSKLENVPRKYWQRDGDKIVEMSIAEKQKLIDARQLEIDVQTEALDIDALIVVKALVKVLIFKGILTKTDLIDEIKGL